jgi:hypothetical protein
MGNMTNFWILEMYAHATDSFRLWFLLYDTLGTNVLDQFTVLLFTIEVKLKTAGVPNALTATYMNKHRHNTYYHTENFHSHENHKYHKAMKGMSPGAHPKSPRTEI